MAGPGAGSLRSPALRTRDRGLRHLGQRRSCPPRPARRGDPARPARSGRHPTLPPNLGLAHRPPPGRARRPGHPVQPPAHRTGPRGVRHARPRWHPRADRHRNRPCRGRHRRRPHRRPPGGDLSGPAARRAIRTAARPALRGHRRHSPPPPRQRRRPAVRQPASAPACATTSANTPCATALESATPRGSITACPNIRSPGVPRDSSAAESVVGWSTTPAVCDRVARGHASPVGRGIHTNAPADAGTCRTPREPLRTTLINCWPGSMSRCRTDQLRRAYSGGDPERDLDPDARGEQPVEPVVGNRARAPLRRLGR